MWMMQEGAGNWGGNKKRGSRRVIGETRVVGLEASDVRCLETLRSLGDFEFNGLTLVQRLVAIGQNRREVNENIFAGLALNESESLCSIEPLYCSLFFH